MFKKNIKIIIFVEGEDDSEIWYKLIEKKNLQNKYFVISGGGTNLVQSFIDVEYAISKIQTNDKIYFFGLFDYDDQGLEYKKILSSYNSMTKCYTLKSLNIPNWAYTEDGNIEIEDLLYNEQLKDWVNVGYFLNDYDKNARNYLLVEKALFKLIQIIEEKLSYE